MEKIFLFLLQLFTFIIAKEIDKYDHYKQSTVSIESASAPYSHIIFICLGGFVSPKHIMTSANCLGVYEEVGKTDQAIFYRFTAYEVSSLKVTSTVETSVISVITTKGGKEFEVVKLFVHDNFAVSRFNENEFIYDIGILKTQEEHDTFYDFPSSSNPIKESLECVTYEYKQENLFVTMGRTIKISKSFACPSRLCELGDIECAQDLIFSKENDGFRCMRSYGYKRDPTLAPHMVVSGIPIVCGRKITGVHSRYTSRTIIWTSLSTDASMNFIRQVLDL